MLGGTVWSIVAAPSIQDDMQRFACHLLALKLLQAPCVCELLSERSHMSCTGLTRMLQGCFRIRVVIFLSVVLLAPPVPLTTATCNNGYIAHGEQVKALPRGVSTQYLASQHFVYAASSLEFVKLFAFGFSKRQGCLLVFCITVVNHKEMEGLLYLHTSCSQWYCKIVAASQQ